MKNQNAPLGLPSGYEQRRRVAPKYNPGKNPIQERYVDTATGHIIVSTQNCDDTISGVHEAGNVMHKRRPNANSKYLGSVPLLVCQIWAKESGTRIGTREFTEYAHQKLKFGDYAKFRVFMT
jgi:hypothetical protein